MTYLPKIEPNNCIVVDNLNSGYIRVYDEMPYPNSSIHYIDYFLQYDYITREGYQTFSNYSYSVNCQAHNNFTTDYMRRVDFPEIVLVTFILAIVFFYIPFKVFIRFFKRGSL